MFCAPGVTCGALLALAPDGSKILEPGGEGVPADQKIGSGMTLVKAGDEIFMIIIMGDNNGDGAVTAADARLALRNAVELESFADWQTAASLVGENQAVTAAEARLILRGAVGLEDPAAWFAAA